MKNKKRAILLRVASAVFIAVNLFFGAAFAQNIPSPRQTEEVRQEARLLGGVKFDLIYYASSLSVEELKQFYRSTLTNLGWQEKNVAQDLKNLGGPELNQNALALFNQNLVFIQGEEIITVTFVPGLDGGGRTRFTVSRNVVGAPVEESNPVPELLGKSAKDVLPLYPGAALMDLNERKSSFMATYYTKDDIETVGQFYKNRMPNYGWWLKDESATQQVKVSEEEMSKYARQMPACPECEKAGIQPTAKPADIFFKTLAFSNENGDTCNLALTFTKMNVDTGIEFSPDFTMIVVSHEEKR